MVHLSFCFSIKNLGFNTVYSISSLGFCTITFKTLKSKPKNTVAVFVECNNNALSIDFQGLYLTYPLTYNVIKS